MNPRTAETKSYHHGDLRGALIAAAERLMEEQASWTFTLREVARAAGVSHNAPYNHFADRLALLAAVAARGFDDLTAALQASAAKAALASTDTRIRMIACAYVAFAVRNASRYRLMFSAELSGFEDPAFRQAGERAFDVLRGLVEQGVTEGTLRADVDGAHALTAWSLVHGFGTLILDGKVPRPEGDQSLAALTTVIAETLIQGLLVH